MTRALPHPRKFTGTTGKKSPPLINEVDPALNLLVQEIIGRVADKWTMLALEALTEHGRLRFTRLGEVVGGVSQKMLTKTLRQMEADGLVLRHVFAVIPPRVEYELTARGLSLGAAFCGVWSWAEQHREGIVASRQEFDARAAAEKEPPLRAGLSVVRRSR